MFKPFISSIPIAILSAVPALAQSSAYVFDPPSNVRNAPNGAIVCTIARTSTLNVYQKEGQWYYTDACGGGYIHQSQIRLQSSNSNGNGLSNRAKVVGIEKGQLALRDAPNGNSLAGLDNGNVVQIIEQQNNWAYVEVISGPNARINRMRGWVNSHYLALF